MEKAVRERFRRTGKEWGIILGLGMTYFIFVSVTGLYIPCPIRTFTGYLCPGCGISHMFVHLFHGEIREAFYENPYVFMLLPIGLPYAMWRSYRYVKLGIDKYSRLEILFISILLIAAIAFGIIRNMV